METFCDIVWKEELMNLKKIFSVAVVLLLLSSTLMMKAQTKQHRVLFAITSGDEADWHMTLGNIRHLMEGFSGDSVEVEVVAYGPGVNMVKRPSSVDADIQALETKHVRFVACENSMRAQKMTVADLVTGVGTVPAGIVEVVTKQEQGWTYIKAGR